MWLPPSITLLACTVPVDMRCSFNGLSTFVRAHMHCDPLDGRLYLFFNRTRDQVRILYFERGGYCMWAKRLERSRFRPPWGQVSEGQVLLLTPLELTLLLEGIEIRSASYAPRWSPHAVPAMR